jgi:hypothetical protein
MWEDRAAMKGIGKQELLAHPAQKSAGRGIRKDLVLGSTGSLGSAIVNELASTAKPVRALVRDPNVHHE